MFKRADMQPAQWSVLEGLTPYPAMIGAMTTRVEAIVARAAREAVWLAEHPVGFSAGTRADALALPDQAQVSLVRATGLQRGGSYSYHGPGVRGVMLMLDLRARRRDVEGFVGAVEDWLVMALGRLGVAAIKAKPYGTIWVAKPGGPARIATTAFHFYAGVSSYGAALFVNPNLGHFAGLRQCGLTDPVTSLVNEGVTTTMAEVDEVLKQTFVDIFGQVSTVPLTL